LQYYRYPCIIFFHFSIFITRRDTTNDDYDFKRTSDENTRTRNRKNPKRDDFSFF